MSKLELRPEFLAKHMRATAIELSNRTNTGWAQRNDPNEILDITYPTADVQRALEAIATSAGKPVVLLGQRGSGKSHIMAMLHHTFGAPQAVENWATEWGSRLGAAKLSNLRLQRGFVPLSETLSNQEYPCLWDVIFDRHPRGGYYRGRFEAAGTSVPAKSLLHDMFKEQKTALILDELQTWFDGLHDEAGDHGKKRRQWAFNFIQILSELAKERPDLLCFVVSVRDSTTEAYRQIHRDGPILVDFKGESARADRKRLVLHRLFQNRSNVSTTEIKDIVAAYAGERNRLLFAQKTDADKARLCEDVVASWPFSPELLNLLDDHILMAAAAQENRDLIRILAEVFRVRGAHVPVITPADFCVDDDACGVTSLLDSFATSADQERLREKAIRNLQAIQEAKVDTIHAREVISSIWMRSLSVSQDIGGTRNEVQLDITRCLPIDDNGFTAELATIVENSFNIHEIGTHAKRFCFKLPENPEAKLKAWARNDRSFDLQTATAPGLLAVRRDQEYLRMVLNYVLKSPDGVSEQPSHPIVLDPNWEKAPWANLSQADQPSGWPERGTPVLIVLPTSPKNISSTLGPWLAEHVPVNRNMVRFLLPKAGSQSIYDDRDLLITARCALLAKEWKEGDSQYQRLHKRYEDNLKGELKTRFDRYAILSVWHFQAPATCVFHVEHHGSSGSEIIKAAEAHIRQNFLAPEDFDQFIVEASKRNDTMKQVLALLRSEPIPGISAIPYLGELPIYEQVLRVAARDRIALNVGGRWYHKEPAESDDAALFRLKQRAWRTGHQLHEVQLGEPSQVGGSSVAAVVPLPASGGTSIPTEPVITAPVVSGNGPNITEPSSLLPVIRKTLGAKSGINLLGDLEKWALSDGQKVTQASLIINGVTIKDLRDLCTKLPPRILAELQITLPAEKGVPS